MKRYVVLDIRNDKVLFMKNRAAITAAVAKAPFFRVGFTSASEKLRASIHEHRMDLAQRFMEVV